MKGFTKEVAKEMIIDNLRKTKREGVAELIAHMEECGFFTQPASTSSGKHLAVEGGLAIHTANVFQAAMWGYQNDFQMLFEQIRNEYIVDGKIPLNEAMEEDPAVITEIDQQIAEEVEKLLGCDANNVAIAAILHDLGKAGFNGKPGYVENILKSNKRSDSKPYKVNPDLIKIPHQDLSVIVASKYIELDDCEYLAIKYHNGLYTPDGREIKDKEPYIMILIHSADMKAARVMEG